MTRNKVIFVVMLLSAAIGAGLSIPLFALFVGSLTTSLVLVGVIIFGREGISAFGRMPAGDLSDRWGRKPILLLGTGCYTISPLAYSLITNPLYLFPFTVLHGIGIAAIWTTAFASVSDMAREEQQGLAFGLFSLIPGIGFSIGTILGGILSKNGQFVFTFRVAFFLGLIAFLLCLGGFKETHDLLKRNPINSEPQETTSRFLKLLRNQTLLFAVVVALAGSLLLYMCLNFFPLYGAQVGLNTDLIAIILVSQSFVGGTLMSPLIGILADRFDKATLLLLMVLLGILVVGIIPLMKTFWSFFFLFFLLGMVGSGIQVIPLAFITESGNTTQKGLGLGLIQTGNQMGRAISPLLFTLLAGMSNLTYTFWGSSLIAGILLIAMFPTARKLIKNSKSSNHKKLEEITLKIEPTEFAGE